MTSAAPDPVRLAAAAPCHVERGGAEAGQPSKEFSLGNPVAARAYRANSFPLLDTCWAGMALVARCASHTVRVSVSKPAFLQEGRAEYN